ncbi:spore germination protein [Desulforamulus ruminis]|nr:spore germination protein [Desulforamulus ruminis]
MFGKWKGNNHNQQSVIAGAEKGIRLTGNLDKDRQTIYEGLGGSVDIICTRVLIGSRAAILIYIDGIVDVKIIRQDVLSKLQQVREIPDQQKDLLRYIAEKTLSSGSVKRASLAADVLLEILLGKSLLLIAGSDEGLVIETRGGERRAIDEPPTERTVRGSREGFIEDLTVNLAILRRKIKSPELMIQATTLGRRSRTKVAMVYLTDIADPQIVQEVRHRLSQINVDAVLASGYLERFFEDYPNSLFPQVFGTERPDRVVANLLEGRVAILVDGTPFVLLVPTVFMQFLQGSEDYYERTIIGSAARMVRLLALIITTTLTPVYIALITFHHSLMPTDLLLAVAEIREELPFTPLVEALFMEVVIELLREAGLRLPSTVGQTLGVVGGIVIGQAVISAKLVSPLMVVVVSLATISSFVFPNYSMGLAIRLIKFPMMLLAAMFGAVGIAVGLLFITIHLVSLESFGVPYMSPLAPTRYADLGDTFVVSRIWKHKKRPVSVPHIDNQRIGQAPREQQENEK